MTEDTFSFQNIIAQQTYKLILGMKSTNVEIPTKVLLILANEIYVPLKSHAYGLDRTSLKVSENYLPNR